MGYFGFGMLQDRIGSSYYFSDRLLKLLLFCIIEYSKWAAKNKKLINGFSSVSDPDPFHFILLDPDPAISKTSQNYRNISNYKSFIISFNRK